MRAARLRLSAWERERLILPLQRLGYLTLPAWLLGLSITGEAILPLFAVLHWCVDQHQCFCGIWLVPLNEIANGCVKWVFRRGRPAWEDARVTLHSWSCEFSFPSSHAQLAAAIWMWLVLSSSHAEAVSVTPPAPAAAYVLLVALSRVQQGLHYPTDVAVGAALGALSAAAYARLLLPALAALDPLTPLRRLAALSAPLLPCAAALRLFYTRAIAAADDDDPRWSRHACRGAHARRRLDPRGEALGGYTGMLGVLAGLAIGGALKHNAPLPYPPTRLAATARALLGNAGLLAMFEAVAAATPPRPLPLYSKLRFAKYALVPVYILLLAPALFVRIGI